METNESTEWQMITSDTAPILEDYKHPVKLWKSKYDRKIYRFENDTWVKCSVMYLKALFEDKYAILTQDIQPLRDDCEPIPQSETPTLRDQFAMAALTGITTDISINTKVASEIAYQIADAMMEARK